MKVEGDDWVFPSGVRRYGCGELSIGFDDDGNPSITYGYDGGFWSPSEYESAQKLTTEDLIALATYQIAQWECFKKWLAEHPRTSCEP